MDLAKPHYEKSMEAKKNGDLATAYNELLKAIDKNPNEPAYRLNFALVACEMLKGGEVIREQAYFQASEAARLNPGLVTYWIALAEVALNCYKFNESIAAYEKAISMDDKNAKTYGLLGFAYARVGRSKDALECYERATSLDPELGDVHFLLSCMYVNEEYNPKDQAFHGEMGFKAKKPANLAIESCWNAAHGYLGMGEYEKGWNYFEARLRRNISNQGQVLPQERFKKPIWTKQRDCRVMVQQEMGFGDCLIMARFLPIIKERFNVEVQLECQPQLLELMQANFPNIKCFPYGKADEDCFDYHIPMMSLPLICDIRGDSIPNEVPYIRADHKLKEEWKGKIKICKNSLNIGICWAGGARNYNASNYDTDKKRSVPFKTIKPILDLPINFISLQPESDDLPKIGIKTFSDTAAIMELLDGVVTVDTAVANLAGAMGIKTWLMNRYDTCWRWSEYLVTPWFPTVRDIRQKKSGEWGPVIEKIVDELKSETDKINACR